MSFSTVGMSKNDKPVWALTVMDVTPLPHPHSDKVVGSTMREGDEPPPFATVEEVLLAAIVYPLPNAGPSRRPRQVLLAWRMRGMLDEVRELGSHLGFEAVIEDLETAEAISEAHGTDVEGRNHGPGRALVPPYDIEGRNQRPGRQPEDGYFTGISEWLRLNSCLILRQDEPHS